MSRSVVAARQLTVRTVRPSSPRLFSTTTRLRSYEDTIGNLKIGEHTRVIFQGFTGRQATANAKESLNYGTKIVGGVTPGRTGEHLGLPVLPSVRKAMENLKPDATGIYVAAHQTPAAIEEAIEAEVPLIVAVAEYVPIHDIMRIHSILKTQSKSRLVGANCPGIISAVGRCRIGFQPLPCFSPGRVGIVAKSGTLSYEAVASTTRAGLGQSLCIGMGGDVLAGTNFVDALNIFEHDKDTDGILLIGEIGGNAEIDAAEWIRDYHKRSANPKPIAALIGGVNAAPGRVMGHAGAFILPGEPDAATKIKVLQDAGVTMINHPAKFGEAMKGLLGTKTRTSSQSVTAAASRAFHTMSRSRGLHTSARRPLTRDHKPATQQKRSLFIREDPALDLLRQHGINAGTYSGKGTRRLLAIGIDRSTLSPCIIASPNADASQSKVKRFSFDYRRPFDPIRVRGIASHLNMPESSRDSLPKFLQSLISLFKGKEAFLLETHIVERLGDIKVVDAHFGFDDAAFRSSQRQGDIHALRRTEDEVPAEVEAEKEGMAYIRLADPSANIGTLVNGAGLAMNTVDALVDAGGKPANFLDTGGKATSETVKKSFQLILEDSRVKVIFVNVFGGLTRGDMIAEGILLAFKELKMEIPIVVRIRGTNEKEGQKMIAESGFSLYAYDDFEEAAAKAIELANSN